MNDKNITDLWLTHSVLSLVEYFGTDESGFNPLSPLLNLKVVSLFGDAILRSKASEDGEQLFLPPDATHVLNPLLQAEDMGAVESIGGTEKGLLHWISVMASSQIRFQARDLGPRIARSYAMLAELPEDQKDRLKEKHGSHFVHLPAAFAEHFGLSFHAFFQSAFRLFAFYKTRHDDLGISARLWSELSSVDRGSEEGLQMLDAFTGALIDQSKAVYTTLVTDPQTLRSKDDPLPLANLIAFFGVSARDTNALRELHSGAAAQSGYYGHQLSPLEMFPIVELPSEPEERTFVVPDFRKLDAAVTQIPHFALMKAFPGNEYNELLGSLQEIYIEDLTRSRLDAVYLISEQTYGKQHVHGPDLTVIDTAAGGLICIESKAKRMRALTKVNPLSENLVEDLQSGLKALERLPQKIEDLYDGLPEYADHQAILDGTKAKPPVCVIVLGEGVFSLSYVATTLLDAQPDHFIHSYPFPYCIMSLEVYERAVEVTSSNKLSLYDTLYSYWQTTMDKGPKEHAAEDFFGLSIDTKNWYLGKYRNKLLEPPRP